MYQLDVKKISAKQLFFNGEGGGGVVASGEGGGSRKFPTLYFIMKEGVE